MTATWTLNGHNHLRINKTEGKTICAKHSSITSTLNDLIISFKNRFNASWSVDFLLLCCMIHDLSGEEYFLEDLRFSTFPRTGPGWAWQYCPNLRNPWKTQISQVTSRKYRKSNYRAENRDRDVAQNIQSFNQTCFIASDKFSDKKTDISGVRRSHPEREPQQRSKRITGDEVTDTLSSVRV